MCKFPRAKEISVIFPRWRKCFILFFYKFYWFPKPSRPYPCHPRPMPPPRLWHSVHPCLEVKSLRMKVTELRGRYLHSWFLPVLFLPDPPPPPARLLTQNAPANPHRVISIRQTQQGPCIPESPPPSHPTLRKKKSGVQEWWHGSPGVSFPLCCLGNFRCQFSSAICAVSLSSDLHGNKIPWWWSEVRKLGGWCWRRSLLPGWSCVSSWWSYIIQVSRSRWRGIRFITRLPRNTWTYGGQTESTGRPSYTQADHGNTQADQGNTQADQGNTQADQGNTQADHGNTQADHGNTQADHGNTQADHGNPQADQGNTQADQGNTQADQGNTQADQGNTQADQGNTQADQGNPGRPR